MSLEINIVEGKSQIDHHLNQALLKILPAKFKRQSIYFGLHFISSQRIRQLNRQFRQNDQPTDVLSFPLNQFEGDNPLTLALEGFPPQRERRQSRSSLTLGQALAAPPFQRCRSAKGGSTFEPSDLINQEIDFGDIFICKEIAAKNKHSIRFLIIHGFLHLLGFNHETEKEYNLWQRKEKAIIDSLNQ